MRSRSPRRQTAAGGGGNQEATACEPDRGRTGRACKWASSTDTGVDSQLSSSQGVLSPLKQTNTEARPPQPSSERLLLCTACIAICTIALGAPCSHASGGPWLRPCSRTNRVWQGRPPSCFAHTSASLRRPRAAARRSVRRRAAAAAAAAACKQRPPRPRRPNLAAILLPAAAAGAARVGGHQAGAHLQHNLQLSARCDRAAGGRAGRCGARRGTPRRHAQDCGDARAGGPGAAARGPSPGARACASSSLLRSPLPPAVFRPRPTLDAARPTPPGPGRLRMRRP